MKTFATRLILSGAVFALAAGTIAAQNSVVPPEGTYAPYPKGVGPALDGAIDGSCPVTELPKQALCFIGDHFPNADVVSCTRDHSDGEFDVMLQEGTQLEFNYKGNWVEVEAGVMRRLSPALVKQLIPEKAYKELENRNLVSEVEKVKRGKDGYKVELREIKYDDMRFANDGKLLSSND